VKIIIKSNALLHEKLSSLRLRGVYSTPAEITLTGERHELHASGVMKQLTQLILSSYVHGADEKASWPLNLADKAVLNSHTVTVVVDDGLAATVPWYMSEEDYLWQSTSFARRVQVMANMQRTGRHPANEAYHDLTTQVVVGVMASKAKQRLAA